MKYALIQDFEVRAVVELSTEAEVQEHAQRFQSVYDITEMVPEPKIGWIFAGGKILPPITADQAELVCLTIYDPMKAKFEILKRRFIGENILWGISQLGKTRAVADFMAPIQIWFDRVAPIEVVTEIEIAKAKLIADQPLQAMLAPFITTARLDWYKLEVLKAAGVA